MDPRTVKCRRHYLLPGTPSMGGMPAVPPELVYVTRRAGPSLPAGWFIVRLEDGGRLCMHASRFSAEVAP